jgi:hypothetical protein
MISTDKTCVEYLLAIRKQNRIAAKRAAIKA